MSSKIFSAAVIGLAAERIEVEADTSNALPGIFIVGLPDKAVDESRERVRAAIKNSGLEMPRRKVTINLAPADLKKVGPAYDLSIAMSILQVSGQVMLPGKYSNAIFVGELALDGSLRPVNGILTICLALKEWGVKTIFVPKDNEAEASLVPDIMAYGCVNLRELVGFIGGEVSLQPATPMEKINLEQLVYGTDMADIRGQEHVKRALEIAAAGAHNILLSGPPGSGKTLLARAMTSILPAPTLSEALEVTKIYSVAGLLPSREPLITYRPFRSPHHSASGVALVGGGSWPKPGEISLAHRGVLFLDELPEFPRIVLEHLRQPLEEGFITVSRAVGSIVFPAQFILVAAMNPCPCGYLTDPDRVCTCSPQFIERYQKKISGPLLDRIDLHIEVPKVKIDKLTSEVQGESSGAIRNRITAARAMQLRRFIDTDWITNAEMSSTATQGFCRLDEKTSLLLKQAVSRLQLSARSYFRVLKVSRTIADLAGSVEIGYEHVAEALRYRPRVE